MVRVLNETIAKAMSMYYFKNTHSLEDIGIVLHVIVVCSELISPIIKLFNKETSPVGWHLVCVSYNSRIYKYNGTGGNYK